MHGKWIYIDRTSRDFSSYFSIDGSCDSIHLYCIQRCPGESGSSELKNLKSAVESYFIAGHELPKTRYASNTVLNGYISHLPAGYEIAFDTVFNTDNTAAATIVYIGGNAKFVDISKNNPEVRQLTVDTYIDLPGVEIRIVKW